MGFLNAQQVRAFACHIVQLSPAARFECLPLHPPRSMTRPRGTAARPSVRPGRGERREGYIEKGSVWEREGSRGGLMRTCLP